MLLILEQMPPAVQEELRAGLEASGWEVLALQGPEARLPAFDASTHAGLTAVVFGLDPPPSGWRVRLSRYRLLKPMPVLLALVPTLSDMAWGVQEGISDFVLPPYRAEEVDTRIRIRLQQPRALRLGSCELDLDAGEARWPDRTYSLTAIEIRLLIHLWRQAGHPVERDTLLKTVWGYPVAVDTRAVALTISRLRKKMEEQPDVPRYLLTAYGVGYRLVLVPETEVGRPTQAFDLPSMPSELVGRAALIEEVERHLQLEPRRVVLHGPGGIGKTRVAIAVGERAASSIEVLYCDASVETESSFYSTLSRCVNALTHGNSPTVAELVEALRFRRMLLVLDNVEHLVEVCIPLIRALAGLPELQLLVTSRLQLPGTLVRHLSVPPLTPAEGRTVFVSRVLQMEPHSQWTPEDEAVIEQIVERVDGLPLAIELAASRAPLLTPAQILRRLEQRFLFLGSPNGAAGRHHSLQKTLDDAWELLTPSLKEALQACAVFQGGFELEAAEAVLPASPVSALDRVQALLQHSLIQVRQGTGGPRCLLFESVRAYLAEKGGLPGCSARHQKHYAQVAAQLAQDALGMELSNAMRRFELERPNLLAAYRYACLHAGQDPSELAVELMGDLCQLFWMQGDPGGLALLDLMPKGISPTSAWRVKVQRARFTMRQGQTELARALAEEVAAAGPEVVEPDYWLHALQFLASMDLEQGHIRKALARQQQVVMEVEARGIHRWGAVNLIKLADCYRHSGHLRQGREALERAYALALKQGSQWNEMMALAHLSLIQHLQGELELAEQTLRPWLDFMREVGDRFSELQGQLNLAQICLDAGRLDTVEVALQRAEALESRTRTVMARMFYLRVQVRLAIEQQALVRAETLLEAGLQEYGGHLVRPISQLFGLKAWVHHLQGRPQEALDALERALELYRDVPPPLEVGIFWLRKGVLLAELGELSEAKRFWCDGVELLQGSELPAHRAMRVLSGHLLRRYGVVISLPEGEGSAHPAELARWAEFARWTDARWILRLMKEVPPKDAPNDAPNDPPNDPLSDPHSPLRHLLNPSLQR